MTHFEYKQRYPNEDADYVFKLHNNMYIDGINPQLSSVGRYANTKPRHQNARFSVSAVCNRVTIKATRLIPAGSEIYVSYGRGYTI